MGTGDRGPERQEPGAAEPLSSGCRKPPEAHAPAQAWLPRDPGHVFLGVTTPGREMGNRTQAADTPALTADPARMPCRTLGSRSPSDARSPQGHLAVQ